MKPLIGCLILCSCFASLIGCEDPPEIRQYKIDKSRSDLGELGKNLAPTRTSTPTRMVVAIFEKSDATWFFKFTGPIAAIDAAEDEWTELIKNLGFGSDGNPTLDTSGQWSLGPAKPMRYQTFYRDTPQGQIEFSISSLGPNQNLLANVNRWFGQLQKPPIEEDDLRLRELESKSGMLKVFDETGTMQSDSMSVSPPPRKKEFTFDTLDGWTEGPTNDVTRARLLFGSEKTAPQITVSFLPAAVNAWIPNVQRWARQVDMDVEEKFVNNNTTDIQVSGIDGQKIRLIPDDGKSAAIAVMVVRNERAWFIKLIGEREKVIERTADFDKFVNSFQFK